MKLLLDENLPKKLKYRLSGHTTSTVFEMGWAGKSNGGLLHLMIENSFDVLLTFDKNLQYQQNFEKYSIPVIVLDAPDNTYNTLLELVPEVRKLLNKDLKPGPTIVSTG